MKTSTATPKNSEATIAQPVGSGVSLVRECDSILNRIGVYLINLDRSSDRLLSAEAAFTRINLGFERVPAIDGSLEDISTYPIDLQQFQLRHGRRSVRTGEVGCYFSHVRALTSFVDSNYEFAVILEDDTTPDIGILQVLEVLVEWSNHWDIVPLFHFHKGAPVAIRESEGISLTIHLSHISSAAAYFVNRAAAIRLIEHLQVMRACIDHSLFEAWRHGLKLRGVLPMPMSLTSQSHQSTINIERGDKPGFTSRLPTFAHRSYVAARILIAGLAQLVKHLISR